MRAAALALASIAVAALVAATSTASPGATTPAAGQWEASLTDGFLRFRVAGGTVRDLVVEYRCSAAGGSLWSAFRPIAIREGAASVDGFTAFEAAFRDARHARGSVDPAPGVGLTSCRDSGSRAFSARRLMRPPVVPVAGPWVGRDADGTEIAFTVDAKGLVRDVRSGLSTACATRATPTPFGADAVVRPSTGAFSARSRPVDLRTGKLAGTGQDVDGVFTSARSARGTLRELREGAGACDTGRIAWTARPR